MKTHILTRLTKKRREEQMKNFVHSHATALVCIAAAVVSGITFGAFVPRPVRFSHHRAPVHVSRPMPHHSQPVHHPVAAPIHHHYQPSPWTWQLFATASIYSNLHRPAPPPLPYVYARPPQQIWVDGHYEDRITVVNGIQTTQRIWVPGHWETVPLL